MLLSDAERGKVYVVEKIVKNGLYARRLTDMGFAPGRKIQLKRVAPLGGTFLVSIGGVDVAMRRDAAESVAVEESAR